MSAVQWVLNRGRVSLVARSLYFDYTVLCLGNNRAIRSAAPTRNLCAGKPNKASHRVFRLAIEALRVLAHRRARKWALLNLNCRSLCGTRRRGKEGRRMWRFQLCRRLKKEQSSDTPPIRNQRQELAKQQRFGCENHSLTISSAIGVSKMLFQDVVGFADVQSRMTSHCH